MRESCTSGRRCEHTGFICTCQALCAWGGYSRGKACVECTGAKRTLHEMHYAFDTCAQLSSTPLTAAVTAHAAHARLRRIVGGKACTLSVRKRKRDRVLRDQRL